MEYNEVDPNLQAPSTSGTSTFRSTGCGSDSRLIEIFEKEIDREIADRMGTISEITDNIKKCQQYLDRLRKEAVTKYYMDSLEDFENEEQPSIHPAVRKIIGKRPRNLSQTEQCLSSSYAKWKRKTRKNLLKKHKSKHLPKIKVEESVTNYSTDKPCYIPPKIPGNPQENSTLRGNAKKMHMRVLIGNVAKEIQNDDGIFDPATHKWMVYVRSAPGSLAIDREVSRVHFFLHPSYKPHDIVTVQKPPFTLNRRGWGEFPLRVQLHFKNPFNKPVDIIHHLKLNGARSGLHTRSAETFADLWLYRHKRAQVPNLDKAHNSNDILSLASSMLKEEVPEFSSEVICSKCQTTSLGTDSHDCKCISKDITLEKGCDNAIDDLSSASSSAASTSSSSSSSEAESSDSDDSGTPRSIVPKPLPCWGIEPACNVPGDGHALLMEEIEKAVVNESLNNDLAHKISSCSEIHEKKHEELGNNNCYGNEYNDISTQEQEKSIDIPTNPASFNLASYNAHFATMEPVYNDPEDIQAYLLMEEIENAGFNESLNNDLAHKISSCSEIHEKKHEKLGNNNCYGNEYNNISTQEQEKSIVIPTNPASFNLSSDNAHFTTMESVSFDVKTSDTIDPSEMKLDVREEFQEFFKGFNEGFEPRDYINILTPGESVTPSLPLKMYCMPTSDNQPKDVNMIELNNSKINNSTHDMPLFTVQDITRTNCESALSPNPIHSNYTFLDSNKIMDEVPIDEFINNIVEEEIVLDSPDVSVKNAMFRESLETSTEVPETHNPTQSNTEHTSLSLVNKPQFQLVASSEQINYGPNKPKESALPCENILIPSTNVLSNPKDALVRHVLPTKNKPHTSKGTQKYIKPLPVQIKKPIVAQKELASSNQKLLTARGSVQINLPNRDYVKSQNSLKITQKLVTNKQISPNTSEILKKRKIDDINEAYISTGGKNLASPGSPIIIVSQSKSLPSTPTSSKSISIMTKAVREQNNISIENSRTTSLLKPQFRSNSVSKVNVINPNSLLRPTSPKPAVSQVNVPNLQVLKKSTNQALFGPRLITVSVKKPSMLPSTQQKIQNSTFNSANNRPAQNIARNQPLPQVHKPTIPLQVSSPAQIAIANRVSVEQKHEGLSKSVHKSESKPTMTRNTNVPETLGSIISPSDVPPSSCAPMSFTRKNLLSKSNFLLEKNQEIDTLSNFKSVYNSEGRISSNGVKASTDTVSFHELLSAIHFPKTSAPLRPDALDSGKSEHNLFSDLDCVLSCNSIHSDLYKAFSDLPRIGSLSARRAWRYYQYNLQTKVQILYYLEQLRLLVNTCTFPETESAVRWLVRGLPLVHPEAGLDNYKAIHPYCASSREAYCSWPSFRQAASEWLRAKTVVRLLSLLETKGVIAEPLWTTKTVYWWCRTHGYSPAFCLIGPEKPLKSNRSYMDKLQKKTSPNRVLEWTASVCHKVKNTPEEDVDVVGKDIEAYNRNKSEVVCSGGGGDPVCGRPWVHDMHSYVVKQLAVKVGREALVEDGPLQSVATTLLSVATVALAEDLLRRGLANAAHRGGGSLEPQDVCKITEEEERFDVFTGKGLDFNAHFYEQLKDIRMQKRKQCLKNIQA